MNSFHIWHRWGCIARNDFWPWPISYRLFSCGVAYFMDYIYIWHKCNPWRGDMSRTISRSKVKATRVVRLLAVKAGLQLYNCLCFLLQYAISISNNERAFTSYSTDNIPRAVSGNSGAGTSSDWVMPGNTAIWSSSMFWDRAMAELIQFPIFAIIFSTPIYSRWGTSFVLNVSNSCQIYSYMISVMTHNCE